MDMQHIFFSKQYTVNQSIWLIEYYKFCIQLPMKSISIFRERQHQSMRRGQILRKFQCRRNFLEIIGPNEIQKIKESLQLLKAIMIDTCLYHKMPQCLATIHNIVGAYFIIDIFLMDVKFDPQFDLVKNGNLPVECSWVQLFLIIMNQDWTEDVYEECSAILCLCAYQLRLKLTDQMDNQNSQVNNLVNSILSKVPLSSFLSGSQYKIIENLIQLLQQFLSICKSAQIIRYLLQMNPNILQLVSRLYNDEKLMAIKYLKQSSIVTGLLVIFNSYQFRMCDQTNDQFYTLVQSLKQICFNDFLSPENEQDLYVTCRYIATMSKCGIKLTYEEFFMIESTLFCQEKAMQNLQFLELMNVLMSVNKFAMTNDMAQILMQYMLMLSEIISDSEIKIKSKQLMLLKRHMNNCENELQTQNILEFFQIHDTGHNKYNKLVKLIQFVHNNCELSFDLLMEFVYFLLKWEPSSAPQLVKNQLFALTVYQQFRLMLDELGYSKVIDELQ